jgi:integrase
MLTDKAVKALQPRSTLYRVADGDGLCMEVTPAGAKHWRYRFRIGGKATMVTVGTYPEVSLAEARREHAELRAEVQAGRNPAVTRRTERAALAHGLGDLVAEYLERNPTKVGAGRLYALRLQLGYMIDAIGACPMTAIDPPVILAAVRKLEVQRSNLVARQSLQMLGQVMRYGVATGRLRSDPTRDLKGALTRHDTEHHPGLTDPAAIGELLRKLDSDASADPVTRLTARLLPLVVCRVGELTGAEWSEVDFDAADGHVWRIPAGRMKARVEHHVPLSRQAVAILRELKALTGDSGRVCPLDQSTLRLQLLRLGYGGRHTPHGWRTSFSTLCREKLDAENVIIERCLSHQPKDKVQAAYDRSRLMPKRRELMQQWADLLDQYRNGATILQFKRPAA